MLLKEYLRSDGSSPFLEWLNSLDSSLKYRVQARILKLRDDGHFGVVKCLSQELFEIKFRNIGGGIRLYYGRDGDEVVILLCGENKSTQENDIANAKRYWMYYKNRN